MKTLTISLPESLDAFVERQVEAKGYGDASEYIKSLLSDAIELEANKRLEDRLLEGLETGGDDIEVDERFSSDLKAEVATLISQRQKR